MLDRTTKKNLSDTIFDDFPDHVKNYLFPPLWNIVKEYYQQSFDVFFRCARSGNLLHDPIGIRFSSSQFLPTIYYDKTSIQKEIAESNEEQAKKFLKENPAVYQPVEGIKTIVAFFSDPALNRYLPTDSKKLDTTTEKFVNNLSSLEYINIAYELKSAIQIAKNNNQECVDLYQLFKDFDQYPIATKSVHENNFWKFLIRFFSGGLFVGNAFFDLVRKDAGFIKLELWGFSILSLLFYQDRKIFINFLPILMNGIGERPVLKKCLKQTTIDYARRILFLGLSVYVELLTHDPLQQKILNVVDHIENVAALEVLLHSNRKHSFTNFSSNILVLGSLFSLGLVQYAKLNEFDNEGSLPNALAILSAYPLLSVPKFLINSPALVDDYKKAKKNPREYFKISLDSLPRNSLGFSGAPMDFFCSKMFLLFIPIAFASMSFINDEKWWTIAAKFFLSLMSSAAVIPEYSWSPRIFAMPPKEKKDETPSSTALMKAGKKL